MTSNKQTSKDQKPIDPSMVPKHKPDGDFYKRFNEMIEVAEPDNSPEAIAFSKLSEDI